MRSKFIMILLLSFVVLKSSADDTQPWVAQQPQHLKDRLQKPSLTLSSMTHKKAYQEGAQWAKQTVVDSKFLPENHIIDAKANHNEINVDKLIYQYTELNKNVENSQSDCQPLIFVSFSMPKQSLQQWLSQAKLVSATVIIRGLIHRSFKETIAQLQALIHDNKSGVQLNPTLFTHYHINQVPAVVLAKGNEFDSVYGDVSLENALNAIAKQGRVCQTEAKIFLQQTQRGRL